MRVFVTPGERLYPCLLGLQSAAGHRWPSVESALAWTNRAEAFVEFFIEVCAVHGTGRIVASALELANEHDFESPEFVRGLRQVLSDNLTLGTLAVAKDIERLATEAAKAA